MNDSERIIRGFRLTDEENPTAVEIQEFRNGDLGILLDTRREAAEPLRSSFRLTPATFHLLSEAMSRAAHDPNVWMPIQPQE